MRKFVIFFLALVLMVFVNLKTVRGAPNLTSDTETNSSSDANAIALGNTETDTDYGAPVMDSELIEDDEGPEIKSNGTTSNNTPDKNILNFYGAPWKMRNFRVFKKMFKKFEIE